MDIHIPSLSDIKRALHLQETIDMLKGELASIFGSPGSTGAKKRGRKPGAATKTKRAAKKAKRQMSAEARERIAEAQRQRWAKQKKATKKAASN